MKIHILIAIASVMMTTGYAQTQKGNVLIGADLSNIDVNFQKDNTQFSFNISPKAAWFIQDNTAVGAEVLFGLDTQEGSTSINYGVGLIGRKYKGAAATNLARTTKWFLEVNAGIYGTNLTGDNVTKTSTNGIGLGAGPGIAYFLNDNISLETLLKYNLTIGFGTSATNHNLNLGLGFQIYLPGKKVQQLAENPVK